MKNDLIKRQDAINALWESHSALDILYVDWVVNLLKNMPSAEPEQEYAKDARCTEQAAKILNQSEGFYAAHGVCICGHCEICGNAVCDDFRFCPYCGTTLDWSE